MKNTCVGWWSPYCCTRAGRRARRGVRSSRAPRPAPSSWSDGRARRDMSKRRGAGNPQDADSISVWRSTPDGGLDAWTARHRYTKQAAAVLPGAFEHGCSVTGELVHNVGRRLRWGAGRTWRFDTTRCGANVKGHRRLRWAAGCQTWRVTGGAVEGVTVEAMKGVTGGARELVC